MNACVRILDYASFSLLAFLFKVHGSTEEKSYKYAAERFLFFLTARRLWIHSLRVVMYSALERCFRFGDFSSRSKKGVQKRGGIISAPDNIKFGYWSRIYKIEIDNILTRKSFSARCD